MGCFNFTCSVSNLPITGDTPVRWLALGTSDYDNLGISVDTFYSPISIPITGTYSDYGSLNGYDEDSIGYKCTLNVLQDHSIECEVGENWCHDVAVNSDMPFSDWLKAIWEGRVFANEDPQRNAVVKTHDYNHNFRVVQSMIREDVWQQLLALNIKNDAGKVLSLKYAKERAYKEVNSIVSIVKLSNSPEMGEKFLLALIDFGSLGSKSFGFSSHLNMCIGTFKRGLESNLFNEKDINDYSDSLGEILKVQWTLDVLRKPWLSGHTTGYGQGLDNNSIKSAMAFHRGMIGLCKNDLKANNDT